MSIVEHVTYTSWTLLGENILICESGSKKLRGSVTVCVYNVDS